MSYLVRFLTNRSSVVSVFRCCPSSSSSSCLATQSSFSLVIRQLSTQQHKHSVNFAVRSGAFLFKSNRPLLHPCRRGHVSPSFLPRVRQFHTTGPNRLPPTFWLLIRPVSKLIAVFAGRRIRQWWQRLPPERRRFFIDKLRQHKWKLLGLLGAYAALCCIYYATHLGPTPLTGRIRFVAVSESQYREISDFEFNTQLRVFKNQLLDPSHAVCRRIRDIALHLLQANRDLEQIQGKEWSITVRKNGFG